MAVPPLRSALQYRGRGPRLDGRRQLLGGSGAAKAGGGGGRLVAAAAPAASTESMREGPTPGWCGGP